MYTHRDVVEMLNITKDPNRFYFVHRRKQVVESMISGTHSQDRRIDARIQYPMRDFFLYYLNGDGNLVEVPSPYRYGRITRGKCLFCKHLIKPKD